MALYVGLICVALVLTLVQTGIAATIHRQDPAGQGVLLGAGVLCTLVLGGVLAGMARIAWATLPEWAAGGAWWGIPVAVVVGIACVTASQRVVSVVLVALTGVLPLVLVAGWSWFYFKG